MLLAIEREPKYPPGNWGIPFVDRPYFLAMDLGCESNDVVLLHADATVDRLYGL